jgi:NhaA family Na+:H+ antiporter
MNKPASPAREVPRVQMLAAQAAAALERFFHIQAMSGIVLLLAAAAALIWANSPAAHGYEALWHTPLSFGLGSFTYSQTLHFWINDGLMVIFFLVVGMEIRREIHQGALSDLRQAALPIAAACGGVIAPAIIFLVLNPGADVRHGWAVPTATDIAFAVGVLALLGDRIPGGVRVILLTLAIVDDVIAVLVIALFYSSGLQYMGFIVAGAGAALVILFQRIGVGSAWPYVIPGAVTWAGLLMTGAHPALAGVVLGLMTPVRSTLLQERPQDIMSRIADQLLKRDLHPIRDASELLRPLRELGVAGRELLPPVVRVEMALHPWVAYGVMPLFALANAGVAIHMGDLGSPALHVMTGVAIALVLGKPIGVMLVSWIVVRLGWCRLPPGVTWGGIALVGLLAGIGFTMSIFIAMLAYQERNMLDAAKLGVLIGSAIAAIVGLAWGIVYRRRLP